jgi:hypothetical protein
MILGDEAVKGELVVELGRKSAEAHHGLLPPLRGQAAHIDHISDQILGRVRQRPPLKVCTYYLLFLNPVLA